MNSVSDEALSIDNPRLLSAVYFATFITIMTVVILFILYSFGIDFRIHMLSLVVLSITIFALFGALFGKKIIYADKTKRFKIFLYGFLLVLSALPFYDIFILYFMQNSETYMLKIEDASHLMLVYSFIVLYSLFGAGFWLAILSGFAALYLRRHLVYTYIQSKKTYK